MVLHICNPRTSGVHAGVKASWAAWRGLISGTKQHHDNNNSNVKLKRWWQCALSRAVERNILGSTKLVTPCLGLPSPLTSERTWDDYCAFLGLRPLVWNWAWCFLPCRSSAEYMFACSKSSFWSLKTGSWNYQGVWCVHRLEHSPSLILVLSPPNLSDEDLQLFASS